MAISSRRLYQAALALLVTSETLLTSVNASVYVCGKDYNDASTNCSINPPCPSGDGCPGEKSICFALPDDQCFSPPSPPPTPKPPTNSPTKSPFLICGSDYNDALSNCRSNAQCPSGDGCGAGTACFTIPASECPTDAPTEAPTPTPKVCGVDALDAQAHCLDSSKRCPSGDGCGFGEACFNVPKNVCGLVAEQTTEDSKGAPAAMDVTVEPTVSQTPELFLKVCGSGYADAATNCRTNPKCPSGDGCANGATCFALPPASCPESVPVTTPNLTYICGEDYTDAAQNFCSNPTCPTGGGCASGATCYALPYVKCSDEATTGGESTNNDEEGVNDGEDEPTQKPTPKPTTPEPTTMNPTANPSENPTAKPSENPTAMKLTNVQTVSPIPERLYICGADYTDAAQNFCSNPTCPTGGGCASGAVCYALPYAKCTDYPTSSPSHSPYPTVTSSTNPSLMPSYTPTNYPTLSPIFNTFFCGTTYKLAEENCWLAERCPSGSGCSKTGENCFPISLPRCLSPAPTDAPTGPGPQPSASPTVSPAPSVAPTVSTSPTDSPSGIPTKAPVVNTNFCGSTYNEALANCSEATACPNNSCPSGMMCYAGITCAATALSGPDLTPSVAPTVSNSPTDSPSGIPTKAPVVNTNFCGSTYDEALANCSEATACPNNSCPGGMMCYAGITCAATVPSLPDLTPGQPTDSSDDSTLTAPTPSQPGDSETTTSTPRPTMNWLESIGISGSTPTAATTPSGPDLTPLVVPTVSTSPTNSPSGTPWKAPVVNTKFCGSTYNEAVENCAEATPCPNDSCPGGMICFIGIPCAVTAPLSLDLTPGQSGGSTLTAPTLSQPGGSEATTSTPRPTIYWADAIGIGSTSTSSPVAPTNSNNERYCGWNFEDATKRCAMAIACPDGDSDVDVCLPGQSCYEIGGTCNTMSASTPGVNIGGTFFPPTSSNTSPAPSKKPTNQPEISPDWDWDWEVMSPDSGSGLCMAGLIMRSLVMGGVILGAMVI